MVIIKRGRYIIDTEYHSEKFGWVEMDITTVEPKPTHEVNIYLKKLEKRKGELPN